MRNCEEFQRIYEDAEILLLPTCYTVSLTAGQFVCSSLMNIDKTSLPCKTKTLNRDKCNLAMKLQSSKYLASFIYTNKLGQPELLHWHIDHFLSTNVATHSWIGTKPPIVKQFLLLPLFFLLKLRFRQSRKEVRVFGQRISSGLKIFFHVEWKVVVTTFVGHMLLFLEQFHVTSTFIMVNRCAFP